MYSSSTKVEYATDITLIRIVRFKKLSSAKQKRCKKFCLSLSPARNFEPAIQISDGCDHQISFNVFEWFEFTKTLIHIIEEEKEKEITAQFWEKFTINVIPINYISNDSFKTRKITLTKTSTCLWTKTS
jgi:hypothetical protein